MAVASVPRPAFRVPHASDVARHAILLGFGLLMAFPFIWMILTSFKPFEETLSSPPTIFPIKWQPENYAEAWRAANFPRFFLNSTIISLTTVAGTLVTSTLAGYAFARMRVPGKDALF